MNISFITRWFRSLIRTTRTTRFEILLPLNYNDGSEIEAEKFDRTADELCDRFGGVTQDTVRVTGTTDRTARAFLKASKENWKDRFRQLDIWITSHEIDVL